MPVSTQKYTVQTNGIFYLKWMFTAQAPEIDVDAWVENVLELGIMSIQHPPQFLSLYSNGFELAPLA